MPSKRLSSYDLLVVVVIRPFKIYFNNNKYFQILPNILMCLGNIYWKNATLTPYIVTHVYTHGIIGDTGSLTVLQNIQYIHNFVILANSLTTMLTVRNSLPCTSHPVCFACVYFL